MEFGKVFRFFKKGSKAVSSRNKKKGVPESPWPPGIRIGVFGHANSGKTVYFSILHEDCKIGKDLQISVTDHATANEFLKHYREIWGLSTAVDSGTAVDLVGDKKFPDPTVRNLPLIFNATLDRTVKAPVVTYEYDGRAVSIAGGSDQKEAVESFMAAADGLLFLFDPKLLKAELECQAHVASFIHMIELIAPVGSHLPIPVGLVITKSDILPGFTGEDRVVLIRTENEALLAEDFETLMEHILSSGPVASDPHWSASVREVLVRLQAFLKAVVGRTLDFQIFFVSATGQTPEKIGQDVGRSIYIPPRRITPIGVKAPFHWLLSAVMHNRKVTTVRRVTRWIVAAAAIWIVLFSLPSAYHFWFLNPRTVAVETNIMEAYSGNIYNTTGDERGKIATAYSRYDESIVIRALYSKFRPPLGRIVSVYREFEMSDAAGRLEDRIKSLAAVVADTTLWPRVNYAENTVATTPEQDKLIADITAFHQGDSASILFTRSGRVLTYWQLYINAITRPTDAEGWNFVKRQIDQDQSLYSRDISSSEKILADALRGHKAKQAEAVVAQQAAVEFDDKIVDEINNNLDGKYRLETAVKELKRIQSKLSPADGDHRAMIERYLTEAAKWDRLREYTCKFETLPANARVYFEVTEDGKPPQWSIINQIFQGDEVTFRWKPGQDIHIALDTAGHAYNWGKNASDYVVKGDRFGLFDLEKGLSFPNVRLQVSVRFSPPLSEQLPVLE